MDYEQISLTSQVKNGFHCISFHDTTTQRHYMEMSTDSVNKYGKYACNSLTTICTVQVSAGQFSRKSLSVDYHMYGTPHTDSNNSDARFSRSYWVKDGHGIRLSSK